MKCLTCGYKLAVYKTLADKQANSVTRYYKCSHCSATAVGREVLISDKEGIMDSKFADMISWCQAIANAYEAYSKGRMSKEVYLAIFKEKLKDKPDLGKLEGLKAFGDDAVLTMNSSFTFDGTEGSENGKV